MKLHEVLEKFKDNKQNKYRRAWLVNATGSEILAEMYFDKSEPWKNDFSPFVFEEYKDTDVIQYHTHSYHDDAVMIYVYYDKKLHDAARAKWRDYEITCRRN